MWRSRVGGIVLVRVGVQPLVGDAAAIELREQRTIPVGMFVIDAERVTLSHVSRYLEVCDVAGSTSADENEPATLSASATARSTLASSAWSGPSGPNCVSVP